VRKALNVIVMGLQEQIKGRPPNVKYA